MRKKAICFTLRGKRVIERINQGLAELGTEPAEAYISMREEAETDGFFKDGFIRVTEPLADWVRIHFRSGCAILFIGAAGIAVRALTGLPSDKLIDSPVIVIDDNGRYVIPILSGHAGGANKLAILLASVLGAEPVITTSTDINDAFSVDMFAAENRLEILNREGIRQVSAKALEGKSITLSIRDYPPKGPVDIIVADDTDAEYSLLLKPRRYTVGLGMKRDTEEEALEGFFLKTLEMADLRPEDVYAICTIDLKENEPALTALRDRYRIPVLTFDRELLAKAEGTFTASEFVQKVTGVDNVCERAAVMGAGGHAELVLRKQSENGMTMAIARRNVTALSAF